MLLTVYTNSFWSFPKYYNKNNFSNYIIFTTFLLLNITHTLIWANCNSEQSFSLSFFHLVLTGNIAVTDTTRIWQLFGAGTTQDNWVLPTLCFCANPWHTVGTRRVVCCRITKYPVFGECQTTMHSSLLANKNKMNWSLNWLCIEWNLKNTWIVWEMFILR